MGVWGLVDELLMAGRSLGFSVVVFGLKILRDFKGLLCLVA